MTEQAHEERTDERAERPVLRREFTAEISEGDGRTVDVRVVPYDTQARVSDGGPAYLEEWANGCFDAQLRAANRVDVLMNFEHEPGSGGLIGRGTQLRSEADGLHGTFRIFDNDKGNIMLELVREGVLGGVSLEAYAKRSIRTAAGVIRRVDARLRNVALCRTPAFKDAVVLAVREDVVFDEDLLPIDIDPELVERCRRLGIKLPQRMAHPAKTDTPADAGTSTDGTRLNQSTPNTEESWHEAHRAS